MKVRTKYGSLLLKDWRISKRAMMAPIWFVVAFYLLMAFGYLMSDYDSNFHLSFYGTDSQTLFGDPQRAAVLATMTNFGLVVTTGFMCLIFAISIAGGALNRDVQKNSEIFFRSQPVSLWAITSSKFLVLVVGAVLINTAIGLFNFIVYNAFAKIVFGTGNLPAALAGLLTGLIGTGSCILVFGSMAFLLSSIFRQRAVGFGAAIVAGLSIAATLLNHIYGMNLPNLGKAILELGSDILRFDRVAQFTGPADAWQQVLNWMLVKRLVLSGLFFVVATYLYQLREIKQAD